MSRTFTSRPSSLTRGRGTSRGASQGGTTQFGQPGSVRGRGTTPTRSPQTQARARGGRGRSRGARMDYPGRARGWNPGEPNAHSPTRGASIDREQPPGDEPATSQRGQYAGGYTVFSPNEKKRHQINQMAQRETQAYEEYKQANAARTFNYVGTVGGGEMTQDQARNRQAQSVRAQKFNRQMRQEEYRQSIKQAGENEIEQKRSEARRKAEQNATRAAQREAPAEEVRRKREAFLKNLEKNTSDQGPPPSSSSGTSLPHNRSSTSQVAQPTASRHPPTGSGLHSSTSRNDSSRQQDSKAKPIEKPMASQQGHTSGTDQEVEVHDDLTMLTSMFPDLDPAYLNDLLFQLGSADQVLQVLDFGD